MESMGSVKTVLNIWKDCPNAYVAAIVTDKDSTTHSKLSHSKLEMVAAGRMTEGERQYAPEKEGNLGKIKPDKGKLPLDHPSSQNIPTYSTMSRTIRGNCLYWCIFQKGKVKPVRQMHCG
jgi:hypothetical protein